MVSFLGGVRERVLERARIAEGDAVVDVGTGTGLLAIGAVEHVGEEGEVFAVDFSVDCLEEVERVCRDPRVWYLVGSAEVLPLPDESVEVVMTRSVLIYVREKAEAAREFFRVLRPGGRVSIFEPVNRDATPLWEIVDFGALRDRVVEDYRREWPADDPILDFGDNDLVRMFEEAGFRHVDADLERQEQTVRADSYLHGVGAPGRPSLVERWSASFSEDEVEQLVAAVRAHGHTITSALPVLYLAAAK